MFASQHKLDNLNLVVDNNHISMLGFTDDIVSHEGLSPRLWRLSAGNAPRWMGTTCKPFRTRF